MNGAASRVRRARRAIPLGLALTLLVAATASAQRDMGEPKPLARYVPAEGLSVLLEHDGLNAHRSAWTASSTYKLLNETTLGAMLRDITVQILDYGMRNSPGEFPVKAEEFVGLLTHVLEEGFAVGYAGTFNPPQPRAGVVVIRNAGKNATFKRLLASIPPLNPPAAKPVETPGGRKVLTLEGAPIRWWYEEDDFVVSFAPPGADDPVVATLEGKSPNATILPIRTRLRAGATGYVPVGALFLDLASMPPLPPDAAKLGLDGLKGVEASWGLNGKATVTMIGVRAPRPRRGLLALFDQPPIAASTGFNPPRGTTGFTIVSIRPAELADAILALAKQSDPNVGANVAQFAEQFRARTGLSLRDDLAAKIGPRMAISAPSGGLGNLFGMWFHPPDFGVVAELKDPKGFEAMLDRLIVAANRELKAAGAMAPPQPGQPRRPGTEFAEFRKLKPPEVGYVLAVPPSVFPLPAGLRPTWSIDAKRGTLTMASNPASARRLAGSLVLDAPGGPPIAGPNAVILSQSDPSGNLPELLAAIPSIVQFIGFSASQQNGPGAVPGQPGQGPTPFRLAIDPDAIPDVEAMRGYLFPSKTSVEVDNETIRLTAYQAFPVTPPQFDVGMQTPVLVALLLPAVQSAREAARRAQCTNNMKQIALAMHNYHDQNNGFPARAIVDKNGKPLLSWRVAILPFIEQKSLYDQFHLDEPWDSPHNKELIKLMPTTYACPSSVIPPGSGLTPYVTFDGPGALFDTKSKTSLAQVNDGSSSTLMAVETNRPVTWTKPDDLPFDPAKTPTAADLGLGSRHPGGFNAVMADGSVRFIKVSINPTVLKAIITRAGGEIINSGAY